MTTYIPTIGPLKAYRLAMVEQSAGTDPNTAIYKVAMSLSGGVAPDSYLLTLARTAVRLVYGSVTVEG